MDGYWMGRNDLYAFFLSSGEKDDTDYGDIYNSEGIKIGPITRKQVDSYGWEPCGAPTFASPNWPKWFKNRSTDDFVVFCDIEPGMTYGPTGKILGISVYRFEDCVASSEWILVSKAPVFETEHEQHMRDYAKAALTGLLATVHSWDPADMARKSFSIAKAMITEEESQCVKK